MDNPRIEYFLSGRPQEFMWYNDMNQLHNDKAPAVIELNHDGGVKHNKWFRNGVLHRMNGPAYVRFSKIDGVSKPIIEEWYINGYDVTDQVNEMISSYKLPHWSKWSNDDMMLVKLILSE